MSDPEAALAALNVNNSALAFRVPGELHNSCRSTATNKNVVIQVPNYRYHLRQPGKQMENTHVLHHSGGQSTPLTIVNQIPS